MSSPHECNIELMYLWWEASKQQVHEQVSRKASETLRESQDNKRVEMCRAQWLQHSKMTAADERLRTSTQVIVRSQVVCVGTQN